jgi:hypothetical protein
MLLRGDGASARDADGLAPRRRGVVAAPFFRRMKQARGRRSAVLSHGTTSGALGRRRRRARFRAWSGGGRGRALDRSGGDRRGDNRDVEGGRPR